MGHLETGSHAPTVALPKDVVNVLTGVTTLKLKSVGIIRTLDGAHINESTEEQSDHASMRHNLSKNMMHVADGLWLNVPLKRCGRNEVHLTKSYIVRCFEERDS